MTGVQTCALPICQGRITVLSDGTPWRPLIDVADMARAIDWAIDRKPANGGRCLSVNVGSGESNFQVKSLAHAVAAKISGTEVCINTSAPADSRSYQVDFGLYRSLAPHHQPIVSLDQSIQNLIAGLKAMDFRDTTFRTSDLMRLKVLQGHVSDGRLNASLQWT